MFAPSGGKNALCLYLRDLSPSPALVRTHFVAFVSSQKKCFTLKHICWGVVSHQRTVVQKGILKTSVHHMLFYFTKQHDTDHGTKRVFK